MHTGCIFLGDTRVPARGETGVRGNHSRWLTKACMSSVDIRLRAGPLILQSSLAGAKANSLSLALSWYIRSWSAACFIYAESLDRARSDIYTARQPASVKHRGRGRKTGWGKRRLLPRESITERIGVSRAKVQENSTHFSLCERWKVCLIIAAAAKQTGFPFSFFSLHWRSFFAEVRERKNKSNVVLYSRGLRSWFFLVHTLLCI